MFCWIEWHTNARSIWVNMAHNFCSRCKLGGFQKLHFFSDFSPLCYILTNNNLHYSFLATLMTELCINAPENYTIYHMPEIWFVEVTLQCTPSVWCAGTAADRAQHQAYVISYYYKQKSIISSTLIGLIPIQQPIRKCELQANCTAHLESRFWIM